MVLPGKEGTAESESQDPTRAVSVSSVWKGNIVAGNFLSYPWYNTSWIPGMMASEYGKIFIPRSVSGRSPSRGDMETLSSECVTVIMSLAA